MKEATHGILIYTVCTLNFNKLYKSLNRDYTKVKRNDIKFKNLGNRPIILHADAFRNKELRYSMHSCLGKNRVSVTFVRFVNGGSEDVLLF